MDVGFRSLVQQLDWVHRRQVLKLAVVRSMWVALSIVLGLIVADLLFALDDGVRVALDLLVLSGTIFAGIVCYWTLRRSISRERMVARLVEEHYPDFENALVNAIDFETDLEEGRRETLSSELMREEIATASEHVRMVHERAALRPATFKKELLASALLMALLVTMAVFVPRIFFTVAPRFMFPYADYPPYNATVLSVDPPGATVDYGESLRVSVETRGPEPKSVALVLRDRDGKERDAFPMFDAGEGQYFQTIENIQDDMEYFVRIPRGRSKRYRLTVTRLPRIEFATVTYTYPAYTRRASETRVLSGDPIKGYRGTQVVLSLASNRPLKGGTLRVGDVEFALEPEEAHAVGGAFTIEEEGDFSATVIDTEGNESNEPFAGKVAVIEDEKPEVVIAAPGMDSFALPDAEVPILIDASDDLGITKVEIYRSHNESMDDRKAVYAGDGADDLVSVTETMDLKDLGVRPGDVIDYYATATDSRPGGPQSASTESFRLKIISFEEYRAFAQPQMTATDLKEKYERYLDEMEELAEAQERLEAETETLKEALAESGDEALSPEETEELERLAEQQRRLSEAAQALQKSLEEEADAPVIFDVEKGYKEALREFAERLASANEHMENAEQKMGEAGEGDSESREASRQGGAASLGEAGEEQEAALEQLRQNAEEFRNGIQEANENLEKVSSVMADVAMFKYLYSLEKGLEREARFYKEAAEPSLDDQIRLKEISERQEWVREELVKLKEALSLHADELEQLAEPQATDTEEAASPDVVPDMPGSAEDAQSSN